MAPAPAVIAAMALAMSPAMICLMPDVTGDDLLDANAESGEQDGNATGCGLPVLHSGFG